MAADEVTPPPGFQLDAPTPPPGFKLDEGFNIQQRRMGLGKQGDSMEKIRQAVDTAGVRAGGYVTDKLAPIAPGIAAPAGYATNFLVNAATEAPGALLGGGGAKAVASPVIANAARGVMQTALKPSSKALANGDAAKAITTMLDEGIPATSSGAAKLRSEIEKLRGEVADLVKNSTADVDKGYAMSEISKTLDKFKNQVNPTADLEAIKKAWQEFSSLHGARIPVQLAQDIKSGTQGILKDKYGRLSVTPAEEAAQKAMASGLRQGVADAVPGVAERNAQMSAKHNVLNILEPRAAMAGNQSLAGLAPLAHGPETAALMLAQRDPWLLSRIAQAMHQGAGVVPTTIGAAAGAAASPQPKDRVQDIIDSLRGHQF